MGCAEARRDEIRKVVGAMCSGARGRKLCDRTGIKSARRATNGTYALMVRLFGKR
jgi:hypothetical protein